MAEIVLPLVVTAIPDAKTESFIASTLYGQGWSVVFRALDAPSLSSYIEGSLQDMRDAVLIYSPDLPELLGSQIEIYRGRFRQVVGFSEHPSSEFPFLLSIPKNETELLNCLRGSVRSPMIRSRGLIPQSRRARVIGFASPSGATGCTTIAMNVAMELSVLAHETLLIDADVRSPSIAPLLGLHKLGMQETASEVATKFHAFEFTQTKMRNHATFLENALKDYDFVVIDLGSVEEISDSLTDRRWSSNLIHWACENADEIVFVGKSDPLSLHRFESLIHGLTKISISARMSFLLNMQSAGRKRSGRDNRFLEACAPLHPYRVMSAPRDTSHVTKAESDRATLIEVSNKSRLRRSLEKLAVELQA